MTLAAALQSFEGTLLFADGQETRGVMKGNVHKANVYDLPAHAFRFAIANATDNGDYADNIEAEVASVLLATDVCDVSAIRSAVAQELSAFYERHIWPQPRDSRPDTEYLVVIQSRSRGAPAVLHINNTAVNLVTATAKSIGIGAYLADYLFRLSLRLEDVTPLPALITAAVYVGREVHRNVEQCGAVEDIFLFTTDGQWDFISGPDIRAVEENIEPLSGALSQCFEVASSEWPSDEGEKWPEETLVEIGNKQLEWFRSWEGEREARSFGRAVRAGRRAYGA